MQCCLQGVQPLHLRSHKLHVGSYTGTSMSAAQRWLRIKLLTCWYMDTRTHSGFGRLCSCTAALSPVKSLGLSTPADLSQGANRAPKPLHVCVTNNSNRNCLQLCINSGRAAIRLTVSSTSSLYYLTRRWLYPQVRQKVHLMPNKIVFIAHCGQLARSTHPRSCCSRSAWRSRYRATRSCRHPWQQQLQTICSIVLNLSHCI